MNQDIINAFNVNQLNKKLYNLFNKLSTGISSLSIGLIPLILLFVPQKYFLVSLNNKVVDSFAVFTMVLIFGTDYIKQKNVYRCRIIEMSGGFRMVQLKNKYIYQ